MKRRRPKRRQWLLLFLSLSLPLVVGYRIYSELKQAREAEAPKPVKLRGPLFPTPAAQDALKNPLEPQAVLPAARSSETSFPEAGIPEKPVPIAPSRRPA